MPIREYEVKINQAVFVDKLTHTASVTITPPPSESPKKGDILKLNGFRIRISSFRRYTGLRKGKRVSPHRMQLIGEAL